MKQEVLMNHVIQALGLDVGTVNEQATPAKVKLLVKYTDEEVAHDDVSYSSVAGMMLYLLVTQNQILHMLLTVLHTTCSVQNIFMNLH